MKFNEIFRQAVKSNQVKVGPLKRLALQIALDAKYEKKRPPVSLITSVFAFLMVLSLVTTAAAQHLAQGPTDQLVLSHGLTIVAAAALALALACYRVVSLVEKYEVPSQIWFMQDFFNYPGNTRELLETIEQKSNFVSNADYCAASYLGQLEIPLESLQFKGAAR